MNTPICDFVADYARQDISRLHMPGHKGMGFLGCEAFDITEIPGADDLSDASGIILESENNASQLFGSRHTFYSTGGSSQCIKAMLYLTLLHRNPGIGRTVLAGRNAHKAFLHACALLDLEPVWIWPEHTDSLCSCPITPKGLEQVIRAQSQPPMAVYVTSPDYLGGVLELSPLAEVCHAHNIPLLVDHAHGAYQRFLKPSAHPMDLGADLCSDSAHKTLPVLTGGAYLHVSSNASKPYEEDARQALALFGSSSPSYLILQSLDACNRILAEKFPLQLSNCVQHLNILKNHLCEQGIPVRPSEELKLTLNAWEAGYTGLELAQKLRESGIQVEYADQDHIVMMFTPTAGERPFQRLEAFFQDFHLKPPKQAMNLPKPCKQVLSPRKAMLSSQELVPVKKSVGRICAGAAVSCPPAIPVTASGELVSEEAACLMEHLGFETLRVVRQNRDA